MKTFLWLLLKAAIFFLFFAFVVDSKHETMLDFLSRQEVTVLIAFVVPGILVMEPRGWWLYRAVQHAMQQVHVQGLVRQEQSRSNHANVLLLPAGMVRHTTDIPIMTPCKS